MNTIKIQITRKENANFYKVKVGDVVEIPFETYIFGVVASEIGNRPLEACKAQAVASRTYAYPYVSSGKIITDDSSHHQSFKTSRLDSSLWAVAYEAVNMTAGEVLYYQNDIVSPCSYSSCNHGHTTSSERRWGGHRPYLIEQVDAWDEHASYSMKRGHGVGMSQMGMCYAAKQGVSYRDILSFYYPGTHIVKEGSPVAQVKASDLVVIFKQMASEKWKYVAGAHKQGEVDCSGAFYYAYKQLGSYMYHGSNTMYRKYTTEKGKIDKMKLVPGMPVFKRREWTSAHASNGWYETDPGDMYHVGLYIGDGLVVEAQGTKTGVVTTKISTWHYAAKLVDTIYDLAEGETTEETKSNTQACLGMVCIPGEYLNLRTGPAKTYPYGAKAYNGDVLTITGEQGDWYSVLYNGKTLYASKQYVTAASAAPTKQYTFVITVSESGKDELKQLLKEYLYTMSESGVAA